MTTIGDLLRWIFANIFYPVLIIGTFVITIGLIVRTIGGATNTAGTVRRTTGALLPLVLLIFLIAMGQGSLGRLEDFLVSLDPILRAALGVVTGALLMEAGKWLLRTELDGAASLYALFLSTVATFILWALIGGILPALNSWLLGFVLGSSLHIIFRGPPDIWR